MKRSKITVGVAVAASAAAILATSAPADAAGGINIYSVHYDSPGSDTGSNVSLNNEWITIINNGSQAHNLAGWSVRDAVGHVYTLPSVTVKAGAKLRIHTGRGTNGGGDLYWRSDWYIWNNTGDTAILTKPNGLRADTCKWGSGAGGVKTC